MWCFRICHRLGSQKMGKQIRYTNAELVWLKARKEMPRRELHAAFCDAFARQDVSVDHIIALMKRKGWLTGRTGQFKKGNVSPNKGRKGYYAPGSEKGWFKRGERRGVASKLYKPIGTERITVDGYVERKIHDGMPLQSRWRAVHLINWEAQNGPIPEGHCLKCLDGNTQNTAPDNWEAIPRAVNLRLNGRTVLKYDDAEDELKPLVLANAKLHHAAREAERGEKP